MLANFSFVWTFSYLLFLLQLPTGGSFGFDSLSLGGDSLWSAPTGSIGTPSPSVSEQGQANPWTPTSSSPLAYTTNAANKTTSTISNTQNPQPR